MNGYASVRDALRRAAARRQAAERERERAMAEIAVLVVEARRRGLSVSEIARSARLSRMTVYALLRRELLHERERVGDL